MDDWIDYYDSTHTIYASKLHRDLHFQIIAKDITSYITSPDAVVLDYACGEALSAARVAEACSKLFLAEPAPGVRGRLIARFAPNMKIRVRSLDDVRKMEERSIDLAVMNSVAQYMTPGELAEGRPEGADQHRAIGLPATALAGRPAALQRSRDDRETDRRRIQRHARPVQYRAQSVADDVRRAAGVLMLYSRVTLIPARRGSPRRDRR